MSKFIVAGKKKKKKHIFIYRQPLENHEKKPSENLQKKKVMVRALKKRMQPLP